MFSFEVIFSTAAMPYQASNASSNLPLGNIHFKFPMIVTRTQMAKNSSTASSIPTDLLATQDLVYTPSKFQCSIPAMEAESSEYGACTFRLNGLSIVFRVAKITPTKTGQFVTLWKRVGNGPIQPFDVTDQVDFFVVSTRNANRLGQFVFPKAVFCEKDIVSVKSEGGKRGIRVYPPWDKATSRQAEKTQKWQADYFLEIPQNGPIDLLRAQTLYRPN
jgi:hypothetical protein